jgi:hypothetical protein
MEHFLEQLAQKGMFATPQSDVSTNAISETTSYDLSDVLDHTPELQHALTALRKHPTAYSVLEGGLPYIDEPADPGVLMIAMTSRHIDDAWPSEINETDVVVDPFDNSYVDSMSYFTWTAGEMSVGIKVEEIAALIDAHPRAFELRVAWVTEDLISLNSIMISSYWRDKFQVAESLFKLSRYIPDDDFIAAKMASFPEPLVPDEKRVLHAEDHLVHIATAVRIGAA